MRQFKHISSTSLADATEILEKYEGAARPIAGGTDLLGGLKDAIHPQYPEAIVDLKTIDGLSFIREEDNKLELGALTTLKDIVQHPVVREKCALLAEAASKVASPQIRNMGTLAGNICQEPRCWYYRNPDNTFNCLRKGGDVCNALTGDNRFHSLFGSMRVGKTNCSSTCPAGIDIPSYLSHIRSGKLHEAAKIILLANPMPAITGRICPHFCQDNCARQKMDEPVAIRNIERFMGDYILNNLDTFYVEPVEETGKTIAIIGSGPSGLSAAFYLRQAGHSVVVFDKMDQAGGTLRYAIPSFRLAKNILNKQISAFEKMGIELKLGVEIGKDIKTHDLQKDFDAVYTANGAWSNTSLGIDGDEHTYSGLDFLVKVNQGQRCAPGQNVIVVGGGDVAVDVAVTAKRLGSERVTMVCLETRDEMPASPHELELAVKEGIHLKNSWGVSKILTSENNLSGLEVIKCISVFDEEENFNPKFDESEKTGLETDLVLLAIGQKPDNRFLGFETGNNRGLIPVNEKTQSTDIDGMFAGGDAVTGPATVIEAIAAGRRGSVSISQYLGTEFKTEDLIEKKLNKFNPECLIPSSSSEIISGSQTQRGVDVEDFRGLESEQVFAEVNRCFNCGCIASSPSDLATVLVALDAKIITSRRTIFADDFFLTGTMSSTVLDKGELVKRVIIPLLSYTKTSYKKFRIRKAIDFPIIGIAVALKLENKRVEKARIVLGASAPVPLRAKKAEDILKGKKIGEMEANAAASAAVEGALIFGKNGYKLNILKALVKRALLSCV